MNKFSAACFFLLSPNVSVVFGSNIRGSGLEMKHDKPEKARKLVSFKSGYYF